MDQFIDYLKLPFYGRELLIVMTVKYVNSVRYQLINPVSLSLSI